MTLPAVEKTWQYNWGNVVAASGNSLTDNRAVLLGMVNAMLGFSQHPWTCVASAGGTTPGGVVAGFDGVNRWDSVSKLTYTTTSGNHSWIVLRQTGMAAKAELCIDLLSGNSSNSSTGLQLRMFMSPAAGFGAANGGTDGSAALRPTASDEFPIYDVASTRNWLCGGTTTTNVSRKYVWNVMQSTDGECTRVLVRIPDPITSGDAPVNGGLSALMIFDKVKNPVSGWTTPVVGVQAAGIFTTPCPLDMRLNDAAIVGGRAPGGAMTMYITAPNMGGLMSNERIPQNDITGKPELYPCMLASATAGCYGTHGQLYDLWWCSDKHLDGDMFPASGAKTIMTMGYYAFAWNNTTPVLF